MRRLRVQVTVLLALLGLLVVAWGAAIFLAARDAARSNTSLQSTVERVDELRRTVTGLSRDFVTMETSRRAYLLTGDEAAEDAQFRAEVSAVQGFDRVRQLSVAGGPWGRWWNGWPTSTGPGSGPRTPSWPPPGARVRAAALVAARGNTDRHFRRLWDRQTALEDQLARAQRAYARSQDRTYGTAQTLAVRTALMMLAP
jgi:hypothetical protein